LPPGFAFLQELAGPLDRSSHGVHDIAASERERGGDFRFNFRLRWPPVLLGVLVLGGCFFLIEEREVPMEFAYEGPILSVGHFSDLKHLIARMLTSKEMLRMSRADSPYCSLRKLDLWSLGERGIIEILPSDIALGKKWLSRRQ
jgi:hypothetical protein